MRVLVVCAWAWVAAATMLAVAAAEAADRASSSSSSSSSLHARPSQEISLDVANPVDSFVRALSAEHVPVQDMEAMCRRGLIPPSVVVGRMDGGRRPLVMEVAGRLRREPELINTLACFLEKKLVTMAELEDMGWSLLQLAADQKHARLTALLLKAGAALEDPNPGAAHEAPLPLLHKVLSTATFVLDVAQKLIREDPALASDDEATKARVASERRHGVQRWLQNFPRVVAHVFPPTEMARLNASVTSLLHGAPTASRGRSAALATTVARQHIQRVANAAADVVLVLLLDTIEEADAKNARRTSNVDADGKADVDVEVEVEGPASPRRSSPAPAVPSPAPIGSRVWNMVRARDLWGRTPLHVAARAGNSFAVARLLRVDPTLPFLVDFLGRSPLDVARESGTPEIVRWLELFEAEQASASTQEARPAQRVPTTPTSEHGAGGQGERSDKIENENESDDEEPVECEWGCDGDAAILRQIHPLLDAIAERGDVARTGDHAWLHALDHSISTVVADPVVVTRGAEPRISGCDAVTIEDFGEDLDPFLFVREFLLVGRPVRLRRAAALWKMRDLWTRAGLVESLGTLTARSGLIPYPSAFGLPAQRTSVADFVRQLQADTDGRGAAAPTSTQPHDADEETKGAATIDASSRRDAPAYIFDHPAAADPLTDLILGMTPQPAPFLNITPTAFAERVLAEQPRLRRFVDPAAIPLAPSVVLGKPRPQFFVGPPGSGAPTHFHKNAYNALAFGRKLWILQPPHRSHYSTTPALEWFEADAPALVRDRDQEAAVCVQDEGDVLFVPSGWGHAVLNLRTTVGVAMEFDTVFGSLV